MLMRFPLNVHWIFHVLLWSKLMHMTGLFHWHLLTSSHELRSGKSPQKSSVKVSLTRRGTTWPARYWRRATRGVPHCVAAPQEGGHLRQASPQWTRPMSRELGVGKAWKSRFCYPRYCMSYPWNFEWMSFYTHVTSLFFVEKKPLSGSKDFSTKFSQQSVWYAGMNMYRSKSFSVSKVEFLWLRHSLHQRALRRQVRRTGRPGAILAHGGPEQTSWGSFHPDLRNLVQMLMLASFLS